MIIKSLGGLTYFRLKLGKWHKKVSKLGYISNQGIQLFYLHKKVRNIFLTDLGFFLTFINQLRY